MNWTTPADLRARMQRLWDEGALLAEALGASLGTKAEAPSLFPLEVRLRRPGARDVTERFGAVIDWAESLRAGSRERKGRGYDLRWTSVNNRVHGSNQVPVAVVFGDPFEAIKFIGRGKEAERAQTLARLILSRQPALGNWMMRNPHVLLKRDGEWERLLAVVDWFLTHPRSGLYLRQLDIPGVDTKYIEGRRALLIELLDAVLPPEAVDRTATGVRAFARRYGLRSESPAVRFRILDPKLSIRGLSDLAVPLEQFAQLDLPVQRVFITENVTNGVAFPDMPDCIVIFGMGYGLDRLVHVSWLGDVDVWYWGDIDTHGFGILNRLRAVLPKARSLLMDRETLDVHKELWGEEPPNKRFLGDAGRLTADEYALYDDLRRDRLGERIRLEQERISYGWLVRALRRECG